MVEQYIIRVNKADSAFTYFFLESCDGICFYSTLTHDKSSGFRDIEISYDFSLKLEMEIVLTSLQKQINLNFIAVPTIS